MATLFGDLIKLKAEPDLKQALADAARRERMTMSEFVRRELRSAVSDRSAARDSQRLPA